MIRNTLDTAVYKIYTKTTAQPAAGANATIDAPAYTRSQLVALSFGVVCDANAGNRLVELIFHHGAIGIQISNAAHLLTANDIRLFVAHGAQTHMPNDNSATIMLPIPNYPLFVEGDTFTITIDGIKAGDQIATIRSAWNMWITG